MSNDWSSEILGIKSEVSSLRADVSSVALRQDVSSIDSGLTYQPGVDVCDVKDITYKQSRARERGVNRIFSLSSDDGVVWVIERPTWLKENGAVYSICDSRMCKFYDSSNVIYKVCCGKLEDGKAEPGTFYMGKSGDSITVAFRKTSNNKTDLSCYLGEYDTAIAIGSIADGESKPTVFICGAITPGGGSGSTSGKLPWSLSYDKTTDSIVAYRPSWISVYVDEASYFVMGTVKTEMYSDVKTSAEAGDVYATISTHVGSSNPDLGIIICSTLDTITTENKINETLYVRLGSVSTSTSDNGEKSVSVVQDNGALGTISEEIQLHSNVIAYRECGKYYNITKCSCLTGCASTGEDGLMVASAISINYTMSCGSSGVVFRHPSVGTSSNALVLAYKPTVRVVPFLWANLKDTVTNGN